MYGHNYVFDIATEGSKSVNLSNKIAIQATVQTAAGKEVVVLPRVHMYESKCNLPLRERKSWSYREYTCMNLSVTCPYEKGSRGLTESPHVWI